MDYCRHDCTEIHIWKKAAVSWTQFTVFQQQFSLRDLKFVADSLEAYINGLVLDLRSDDMMVHRPNGMMG